MKRVLIAALVGMNTIALAEQAPTPGEENQQMDTVVVEGKDAKTIYEALNLKPETVTLDTGIAEIKTAASLQCVRQTLTTEENETSMLYSCIMGGTLMPLPPEQTPPKPN